ncbi:hypothetical protein [Sulfitobacter sp.]|uniref:hypothetical protein n=1 Tax=Sulfitobacter sp. TaxID=1903071 RepID=UPI0040593250
MADLELCDLRLCKDTDVVTQFKVAKDPLAILDKSGPQIVPATDIDTLSPRYG